MASPIDRQRTVALVAMATSVAAFLVVGVFFVLGTPIHIRILPPLFLIAFLAAERLRRGRWQLAGPHFFWDVIRFARRGRTFLVRALFTGSFLLGILWVYAVFFGRGNLLVGLARSHMALSMNEQARFAESFVFAMLLLQWLAVMILTPAYVAGAVAEEREKNSLELLLTTYLRDREIVCGKLLGRVVHLAGILLASLPVLALTQFLGGVDLGVLLGEFAVLGMTLFSVGSMCMLISVLSRTVWGAVLVSYAAAVAGGIIMYALYLKSGHGAVTGYLAARALPTSLETTLRAVLDLCLIHAWAGFLALSFAVWCLRQFEGRAAQAATRIPDRIGPLTADVSEFMFDSDREVDRPATKPVVKIPPISSRPLLWKEMFMGGRVSLTNFWRGFLWVVTLLIVPFLLYFNVSMSGFAGAGYVDPGARLVNLARWVVTLVGGLCFLGVGFRAAGSVVRERQARTLDALLTLPLERRTILRAKWLASLIRPSVVTYAFGSIMILGSLIWALYPRAAPFLVVMMLAHLVFAASLGLFVSIHAPTRTWANFMFALIVFLLTLPSFFYHFFLPGTSPDLVSNVIKVGLNPVASWWFWSYHWGEHSQMQAAQIGGSVVGAGIYVLAAWLLWRAACWRFCHDRGGR